MRRYLLGVILFLYVLPPDFCLAETKTTSSDPKEQLTQPSSREVIDLGFDLLKTLHGYYLAQLEFPKDHVALAPIMNALIQENRDIENAGWHLESHLESKIEITKMMVQAILTAAKVCVANNNQLVGLLRNSYKGKESLTEGEFAYQIAQYQVSRKECWKSIAISAGQFHRFASKMPEELERNPTGKIPYIISDQERKALRVEINRLFAEPLKAYRQAVKVHDSSKYDWILIIVDQLDRFIGCNTWEERKIIN